MARYRRGPLAGIEYASERQKRNAREYYLQTGIVLPAEETSRARGLFGQAQRERVRDRQYVAPVAVVERNHEYLLARWRQQNVGRLIPRSDEEFERLWLAALKDNFRPGPALSALLEGAGMRTGLDANRARIHYMQYIRQQFDRLGDVGRRTTLERITRLADAS